MLPDEPDTIDPDRLGELFGAAYANFAANGNDFGTFMLALGNAMTGRTYNWDADDLAEILEVFVETGVSRNPATHNEGYCDYLRNRR